jgi:hypothetical protein
MTVQAVIAGQDGSRLLRLLKAAGLESGLQNLTLQMEAVAVEATIGLQADTDKRNSKTVSSVCVRACFQFYVFRTGA